MDLFLSGGAVSWILLVFGVAATLMFIERWLSYRRAGMSVDGLLSGVKNLLASGNDGEALSQCEETGGPAAAIARAAIENRDAPENALREAMESAGANQVARMERRLTVILTIAQTAPLLGLLGTLWGLFETLVLLNTDAQVHFVQSIDLTQGVARAISSAACGLGVAMLCHLYYNALIVRVDRLILDMERTASEMFVYFSKNKGGC